MAKGQVGLDQYEVRRFDTRPWTREKRGHSGSDEELIPPTVP